MEDVKGGSEREDVSGDVVETSSGRSLKAVCRYGISDLLDCVVWDLKVLSISVNQPPSLVLEGTVVV